MKFRETYNGEKFIDLYVYIYIYISRYIMEENDSKISFQKKTEKPRCLEGDTEFARRIQKIGKYWRWRTKRDRNEALNGKEK